jgi:hypothetical protein
VRPTSRSDRSGSRNPLERGGFSLLPHGRAGVLQSESGERFDVESKSLPVTRPFRRCVSYHLVRFQVTGRP